MDGIGSGFVGYSIPGVPSLRYDLSNSIWHVNSPGVYHTGARYSMIICRDYHPPGVIWMNIRMLSVSGI